jgi:hypothetical protein
VALIRSIVAKRGRRRIGVFADRLLEPRNGG